MSWYFTLLNHVHHSFVLDARVVWIKIGGLPLNAWTPKAFKKIASSWGVSLFVDEEPSEAVSIGRVCIKTKIHGQVNENCKVVILGKSHNVSGKEFAGWAPDIKAMESLSSSNSEMDNSDKHKDDLSDNGFPNKEEGEMPNSNVNEEEEKKETFWNKILEYMNINQGHYIIFGDFNVVRYASERIGTVFNPSSTNVFNQFIRDAHLWDIPLGSHLFTRINKHGDKLSKLDRFLTSDSFAPLFQKYSAHVLDCHISDHMPILLAPLSDNFAPENCTNPIVSFKNKIKALKTVIKDWSLNRKDGHIHEKEDLIKKINDFDANIATRYADLSVDAQCSSWIDNLRNIDLKENLDSSQKAKIKWGIEADKNSKFFYAIVNKKRRYLSIQGIKLEGHWIEDPLGIKDAFLAFFEQKFQKVDVVKIVNRSPFYKSLNDEQNIFLASSVTESEIKDAIWDCSSDKSSGLDGFTFAFYKEFWDMFKSDVVEFVHHFFSTGILPRECNTSFITLIPKVPNPMMISDFRPISLIGAQYKIIAKVLENRLARVIDTVISQEQSAFVKHRQILDGPLMVNEVIQWCKRKKSKLMVFKIDFEKAFDSISWDFLLQVMRFMGPTREFNIHRGLRHGDPLSPFLFIISMEGLHVAMIPLLISSLKDYPIGKPRSFLSEVDPLSLPREATINPKRSPGFHGIEPLLLKKKGALDTSSFFSHVKSKGVWSRIVGSINIMHEKGFIPHSFIQRHVNNGASTKFWHDTWAGISSFKHQYPLLFRLAMNKDCLVHDCWNNGWHFEWSRNVSSGSNANQLASLHNTLSAISLNDSEDAWVWSIGTPFFTVKSARGQIDNGFLPDGGLEKRWNIFFPKKINIFIWRTLRDRIPSRWNLSRKGIDVASITCPVCDSRIETSYHSMWVCRLLPQFGTVSSIGWIFNLPLSPIFMAYSIG
uniref:Putative RNA-directed DNA polymerase, eukaryota, reverse transcriptase zinc-binding domain protein n=1 Tax=Tanacetum cinerariifolium TaxID=118510 RepID=A0A6L2M5W8_TANCI|nr:putative RNA-directed DNA polymerase, eukaryota, reverse transcriptase zinc-binding domain protein [Tanacetum cinerariifolium]